MAITALRTACNNGQGRKASSCDCDMRLGSGVMSGIGAELDHAAHEGEWCLVHLADSCACTSLSEESRLPKAPTHILLKYLYMKDV